MTKNLPTFVGLAVVTIFLFAINIILRPFATSFGLLGWVVTNMAVEWTIALFLLGIVLFWERVSITSLGITRFVTKDFWHGLGLYFVGAMVAGFIGYTLQYYGVDTKEQFLDISRKLVTLPAVVLFGLALTAGITEEIIFRGYLVTRLERLLHNIYLAGFVSYALFVVAHLPLWGVGKTLQIAIWSLIPTIFFIRTKRLMPLMVMHILNDGIAFVVVYLAIATKAV